jgi:transcription elongation factor Elf1
MNAAELLKLLACPVCQDGELLGLDEQPVDGLLRCSRCGAPTMTRSIRDQRLAEMYARVASRRR